MSLDLTHCDGLSTDGTLCPIRSMCRRHDYFRKIENQCGVKNYGQHSSFMVAPYDHKKGDCKMFWGDMADRMFHKLENILGIKIKRVPFGKLVKLVKPKKIGYKQKESVKFIHEKLDKRKKKS